MTRKAGLGRGLGALLGETAMEVGKESGNEDSSTLREVPIDEVVPNPDQPRKNFDEDDLNELADSVRLNGILQPIVVRSKDGA